MGCFIITRSIHIKWFKHYHNASYSVSLSELIDEIGVSGYGHYWLLLELLAEKFDGKTADFEIHFEELSRKIRIKFKKKLETFIQKLPESCVTFQEIRPKVYKVYAPIIADLQGRDFKKARIERGNTAPKKKIKNKNKNKNKNKIKNKSNNSSLSNQDSTICVEVINYLNTASCKKFNPSTIATQNVIKARILEGYTLENFHEVINKKCKAWMSDSKMHKFIRPRTLFGTKFEDYLNEVDIIEKSSAEVEQDRMLNILKEFEDEDRAGN